MSDYYRLPSLTALRAFEAAARHLNVRLAAQELHLTPGAVSQQVQQLEDQLGVKLFERLPRGLRLTRQGLAYLVTAGKCLRLLADGTARIRGERETLNISVAPSFCTRWLIPRLGRFIEANPLTEVRIEAETTMADLGRESVDLAIRHTAKKTTGFRYDLLFMDKLHPVCSSALIAIGLKTVSDLKRFKLLHWSTHDNWLTWLRAANLSGVDGRSGLFFSHLMLALDAAVSAGGVALSSTPLVKADLESGRLVVPFGPQVATGYGYYVVTAPKSLKIPRVRLMAEWLMSEASVERS